MKTRIQWLIALAVLGFSDALYLTYQHYSDAIPPCSTNPLIDCGKVLSSSYATIAGFPLALLGAVHYLLLATLFIVALRMRNARVFGLAVLQSGVGALFSAYLVYLQIGPLGAICLYCMVSAIIIIVIASIAVRLYYSHEYRQENNLFFSS